MTKEQHQYQASCGRMEAIMNDMRLNFPEKFTFIGIILENVSQSEPIGEKALQLCKTMDNNGNMTERLTAAKMYLDFYPTEATEAQESDDDGEGGWEGEPGNIKEFNAEKTKLVETYIEEISNSAPVQETAIKIGLLENKIS